MTKHFNPGPEGRRRASEYASFKDLSFVRVLSEKNLSPNCCFKVPTEIDHWHPVDLPKDDARTSEEEHAIGTAYAMDLIHHFREFPEFDSGDTLAKIVETIVKRGRWTVVEATFFAALGDYIAKGRVSAGMGFFATHVSDEKPETD